MPVYLLKSERVSHNAIFESHQVYEIEFVEDLKIGGGSYYPLDILVTQLITPVDLRVLDLQRSSSSGSTFVILEEDSGRAPQSRC